MLEQECSKKVWTLFYNDWHTSYSKSSKTSLVAQITAFLRSYWGQKPECPDIMSNHLSDTVTAYSSLANAGELNWGSTLLSGYSFNLSANRVLRNVGVTSLNKAKTLKSCKSDAQTDRQTDGQSNGLAHNGEVIFMC